MKGVVIDRYTDAMNTINSIVKWWFVNLPKSILEILEASVSPSA